MDKQMVVVEGEVGSKFVGKQEHRQTDTLVDMVEEVVEVGQLDSNMMDMLEGK